MSAGIVIAAIALVCGEHVCSNVVYEPRFKDLETCQVYLFLEKSAREERGQQVILDDCIHTTEQRLKEAMESQ